MKRALLVACVLGPVVLAAGAAPAAAANECRGLDVCVRVPGPWVVVPTGARAPEVRFQLACPRGFIVGGLDAELSDRGLDVSFAGKLGSPVNPGVTTRRSALFFATDARGASRAATFRPHLGCVPGSGGGRGPVPLSLTSVFPPGEPTVRRVRTIRLQAGRPARAVAACAPGERLVAGWHAVGFYTKGPPPAALVAGVATSRRARDGRVVARARVGALAGVRAVLQVGAVCGGAA